MPTIGVSLGLPEPWASRLQEYRAGIGDDTAHRIPTHITLVAPIHVSLEELPGVHRHLISVARTATAFPIALRGTGTFRPVSPVVFVALQQGVEDCTRLAEALRQGPLEVPPAFPFHPHVTVAHHLPEDVMDRAQHDLAEFACDFTCDGFSLYVHDPNRGWEAVRSYPMEAAAPRVAM